MIKVQFSVLTILCHRNSREEDDKNGDLGEDSRDREGDRSYSKEQRLEVDLERSTIATSAYSFIKTREIHLNTFFLISSATEYHLGLLKAKLAKYRAQLLEPSKSAGAGKVQCVCVSEQQ